jgi:hypothetical protein
LKAKLIIVGARFGSPGMRRTICQMFADVPIVTWPFAETREVEESLITTDEMSKQSVDKNGKGQSFSPVQSYFFQKTIIDIFADDRRAMR